jgi:hypothetical protein
LAAPGGWKTAADLADIELVAGGYALHWPRVNADIRVEDALAGIFGSRKWMQRLAAAEAGKKGGCQADSKLP